MTAREASLAGAYAARRKSAAEIAELVEPGWTCVFDIAGAIPPGIADALSLRLAAGALHGVTLHMLLDMVPLALLNRSARTQARLVSWFSGKGLQRAVREGRADIMPCTYRDMPALFEQFVDVDALLLTVSPMDRHGYFSTGSAASNSAALLPKARHVFLEVNRNAPRALTAPQVHISQVDALCENDAALPLVPPPEIDEVSRAIGALIAEEIPDGATIQLGIGAVPEAVGQMLKDKRDLGIHTELFTDSMAGLIECGAVTNLKKPIHRGKSVATLAFGSERVYRYIDDNPMFEMLPVDYVNDPAVIGMHPDFMSVNAALEVDFYGQVCAESMGITHVSGTGGHSNYVQGAVRSKGGKSFIAFPSTAKGGTVSRIRPTLAPGALVSTGKNDVDYIVTEYGAAKLRGKTLSERTRALIGIAHPRFREELRFAARRENILI